MPATQRIVHTDSLEFHVLEWPPASSLDTSDQTPLAVLLHGFPETPQIFAPLAERLVAAGYQVCAPYLPGYGAAPGLGKGKRPITFLVDIARVFGDLLTHLHQRYTPSKVVLVGHDWGAACAYGIAAAHGDKLDTLVTMAVPPLSTFLKSFLRLPGQWTRSAYMAYFQLPAGWPERNMTQHDFQKLSELCLRWSGGAAASRAYFSKPEHAFSELENLAGPLSYYRGLFPLISGLSGKWQQSMRLAFAPISVPTTILVGELDGCIPAPCYRGYQKAFDKRASFEVVQGAGHFIPLDAPEWIAQRILSSA